MTAEPDRIRSLRAAIERAENHQRQLFESDAELQHARRRLGDHLERLGGRDPESERQRRDLDRTLAVNAGEGRRLGQELEALRAELAAAEQGADDTATF